jgi:hypothetical protein
MARPYERLDELLTQVPCFSIDDIDHENELLLSQILQRYVYYKRLKMFDLIRTT